MSSPKIYDFKQFNVAHEVDGREREYMVEFDLESLMQCMDALTGKDSNGVVETTAVIFAHSIRHNHPTTTMSSARKFVDAVAKDEDFTLDAFADIIEEYTRLQLIFIQGSGEKKKKNRFTALEPKVAVVSTK